jgi:hypothetical protein
MIITHFQLMTLKWSCTWVQNRDDRLSSSFSPGSTMHIQKQAALNISGSACWKPGPVSASLFIMLPINLRVLNSTILALSCSKSEVRYLRTLPALPRPQWVLLTVSVLQTHCDAAGDVLQAGRERRLCLKPGRREPFGDPQEREEIGMKACFCR